MNAPCGNHPERLEADAPERIRHLIGRVPTASMLRLLPEALQRYLSLYEEQLASPSEGTQKPTWRKRLTEEVASIKEMIMDGEVR